MSKIQTEESTDTDELLAKLTDRSCADIYGKVASDRDLYKTFSSFLLEKPIYLSVDTGIAYVVHSLLVNGDSYAKKLMDDLAKTKELRLSDTVFSQISDILVRTNMIVTYQQKVQGQASGDNRGRPRTMLQVNLDSYYAASELAEYWEDFLASPRTFRIFISGEQYNTRSESISADISKTLDFFSSKLPIYLGADMATAYIVHSLIVNGDSYAQKLMEDLGKTEELRISDTVIAKVTETLIRTKIVTTYEERAQGEISGDHRGRNRIMLRINLDQYHLACELVEYWEDFLGSPRTLRNALAQEQSNELSSGEMAEVSERKEMVLNCQN